MDRKIYMQISSAQDLRKHTGSWGKLAEFLQEMPTNRAFINSTGRFIEGYTKELIRKLNYKQREQLKQSQPFLGRYIAEVDLGERIEQSRREAAERPKLFGVDIKQALQAQGPVEEKEMGEPVTKEAQQQAQEQPIRPQKASKGTGQKTVKGNKGKRLDTLPANHHSLFKVYYEYEAQPGYQRGYNQYYNSEDAPSERHYFQHKGHLRVVDRLLKEGKDPNDIFGYGGMLFGAGVNGWNYNYNRIDKYIDKPHPKFGRLVKAYIFFRPLLDDNQSSLCVFAYKDLAYFEPKEDEYAR